ncbi:hypothetical protein [Sphingomonas sp. 37zxx]|uniref:hypothetical protein n=1 Tax=Sphingomonas sp. 37zxx TaxID=1550073 RepID=UPI00053BE958|nr:hypothetical protein [Sphingomonas sp. 37zxx]
MPNPLIVRGVYKSEKPGGADIEAAFEKFLRQIERDVLSGTFDDYDASIFRNKHHRFAVRSVWERSACC